MTFQCYRFDRGQMKYFCPTSDYKTILTFIASVWKSMCVCFYFLLILS